MGERRHLYLGDRKALCGRTRVFLAMAPFRASAVNGRDEGRFDTARRRALDEVTEAAAGAARREAAFQNEDPIRLDVYLKKVGDKVLGWDEVQNPAVGPALKAVAGMLAEVRCETCARGPDVCNNVSARDDDLIDAGGHCLSYFRNLFGLAQQTTEKVYRRHVPDFAAFPRPDVSFRTRYNPTPHSFPVSRFVGGVTFYLDGDGPPRSVVTLDVAVEPFDYASLLATGYVLFHECVCHAYNGARPGAGPRKATQSSDHFAEGWMDWAAMEIYRRSVRQARSPLLTEEALDWGEALRKARGDIDAERTGASEDPRRPAAPRNEGTKAARQFQRLLRRRYGARLGWELFLQTSLDWNVERDRAPRRAEFVQTVNACLPDGPLPDPARERLLLAGVETYRASRQLEALIPPWSAVMGA